MSHSLARELQVVSPVFVEQIYLKQRYFVQSAKSAGLRKQRKQLGVVKGKVATELLIPVDQASNKEKPRYISMLNLTAARNAGRELALWDGPSRKVGAKLNVV